MSQKKTLLASHEVSRIFWKAGRRERGSLINQMKFQLNPVSRQPQSQRQGQFFNYLMNNEAKIVDESFRDAGNRLL